MKRKHGAMCIKPPPKRTKPATKLTRTAIAPAVAQNALQNGFAAPPPEHTEPRHATPGKPPSIVRYCIVDGRIRRFLKADGPHSIVCGGTRGRHSVHIKKVKRITGPQIKCRVAAITRRVVANNPQISLEKLHKQVALEMGVFSGEYAWVVRKVLKSPHGVKWSPCRAHFPSTDLENVREIPNRCMMAAAVAAAAAMAAAMAVTTKITGPPETTSPLTRTDTDSAALLSGVVSIR